LIFLSLTVSEDFQENDEIIINSKLKVIF